MVQSTFLACINSRDNFRKQSSFRTYLFAIARHELYRYFRLRRRASSDADVGASSVIDTEGLTPTRRLARKPDHERLRAALQSLPLEQQVMLELHYWEDMGVAELAEIFDVTPTAMRTRLHRARKAVRELMEAESLREMRAPPRGKIDDFDAWARSVRDDLDG
jgi:RNA polymerase sigma-70 factor (ECF subfamily)